ncbi:diuretic hormone class 2 isoform X1 [Rhodnius prolixus]|uniref:Calcitonin-like diuretic hormone prepropeptide variant C n=4 Tax=Rhodnius prolixus TaxID=13249 RepID=F2VU10_RHOPR|nr:calcitonin-like diuretic hormone prepropeptide variant C [Rhodnius prolixus]
MVTNIAVVGVSLMLGTLIVLSAASENIPYIGHRASYFGDMDNEPDSEVMLEILAKLGQTIMRANDLEKPMIYSREASNPWTAVNKLRPSNLPYNIELAENPDSIYSKRGLDLGLSRGFSGSQAAKHLMGLAAANYAGGPGRRRRQA